MRKLLRKFLRGPKKPCKTDDYRPLETSEKGNAGKIPYYYD